MAHKRKKATSLKPCPKCGKEIPANWYFHRGCGWGTEKKEEKQQFVGKCKIEVFTSPTCPHCHGAVKLAKEIEKERDDVRAVETSTITGYGRRRSKNLGIMALPTTIVKGPGYQGNIGFKGLPSKKGLLKAIDISLGKAEWGESKGFLKRLLEKLPIKIKW